jgi:hypothetical protein
MPSSGRCSSIALPGVVLAVLLAPAAPASAQTTARELYSRALTLERRLAVSTKAGGTWSAADARRVVAAYEAVVRQHPRSGYCDNALWQAGQLALENARRHGASRDRAKGVALLEWLVREYPGSRLVPDAREALFRAATLNHPAPTAVPRPRPAPQANGPSPVPPRVILSPGVVTREAPPAGNPQLAASGATSPPQPLWARALWLPRPLTVVTAVTGLPIARTALGDPTNEPSQADAAGQAASPDTPQLAGTAAVTPPPANPPQARAGAREGIDTGQIVRLRGARAAQADPSRRVAGMDGVIDRQGLGLAGRQRGRQPRSRLRHPLQPR